MNRRLLTLMVVFTVAVTVMSCARDATPGAAPVAVAAALPQVPAEPEPRKGDTTNKDTMVYGMGYQSCGLWLEAYAHRDNKLDVRLLQFEMFLEGFASAYNIYGPDSSAARNDILASTDKYARRAYLDRYCREHPLDNYLTAVNKMFLDLRAKNGQ